MSATVYGRQPLGVAECGLAGQYPYPAIGLALAGGLGFWDDFLSGPGVTVASRYGDQLWATGAITTGLSFNQVTPASYGAGMGILSAATAATANTGGTLFKGATVALGFPPIGAIWCVRLRVTSTATNYELWSGFSNASLGRVRTADSTAFVGVRVSGTGNLFGVTKTGTGVETAVDLGVSPAASAWCTVGFEVGGSVAAPTIQFFVVDRLGTNRQVWDRTNIGALILSTLPGVAMLPIALGLVTQDAVAKTAQIDHWGFGGRISRA